MKEARRGGGLFGLVALLLLLMLAAAWFAGGRQAWNRYQVRSLLRGALQAYEAGRDEEGRRRVDMADERMNLGTLAPGPERDLHRQIQIILVRRALVEQSQRQGQTLFIGSMPREIVALRDLRNECRRIRLPCPAWVELVAVHVDSRDLQR